MKRARVLTAVFAFVSVATAAQVAVAGEQGIQGRQRASMLEVAAVLQSTPPAEWRADRYLATPSMAAGGEAAQVSEPPLVPAEWRADRYLALPSMDTGGETAQASASPLVPAEWRVDRYLATPSMAVAGDHEGLRQAMGIGSC